MPSVSRHVVTARISHKLIIHESSMKCASFCLKHKKMLELFCHYDFMHKTETNQHEAELHKSLFWSGFQLDNTKNNITKLSIVEFKSR
jgi:hypothetical protein